MNLCRTPPPPSLKFVSGAPGGETRYVQLKFFKILLFVLRIKFPFQFVSLICRFIKPETSLNNSNFDRQDFVKYPKFLRL